MVSPPPPAPPQRCPAPSLCPKSPLCMAVQMSSLSLGLYLCHSAKENPTLNSYFLPEKKIQIPSNSDPVKLESKTGFGTQQALNKCPFHTHFHASHSLDQLVPIISVSNVFRPSAGLKVPLPLIPILCLSSWLQLPVQASSSWERGVGGKHLWSVLDELLLYI